MASRRERRGNFMTDQKDTRAVLQEIVRDARGLLEWRQSAGLPLEMASGKAFVARPSVAAPVVMATAKIGAPAKTTTAVVAERKLVVLEDLAAIRADIGDCTRCKLCKARKNIVFGVGDPHAQLVFVGEGPGEEEDRTGEPFVGRAGQLLTKMIEAMGFRRQDVYICNVVKCRPPGNRNPEPDEIAACEPFLIRQLGAIKPKVIVALGKFAAQTLLRLETPISKLRGQWHEYQGIKFMPTFHPAYLLRSPGEKVKAWDDLKLVMKEFGREVK